MQGASIYILRCADGSYYTGITRRPVDERVSEHAQGLIKGCYTENRLPVELCLANITNAPMRRSRRSAASRAGRAPKRKP